MEEEAGGGWRVSQKFGVLSKTCWYLVQVRHEVLVERADQHVQGPLTLLGKCWRLQCGFLSIDYCVKKVHSVEVPKSCNTPYEHFSDIQESSLCCES